MPWTWRVSSSIYWRVADITASYQIIVPLNSPSSLIPCCSDRTIHWMFFEKCYAEARSTRIPAHREGKVYLPSSHIWSDKNWAIYFKLVVRCLLRKSCHAISWYQHPAVRYRTEDNSGGEFKDLRRFLKPSIHCQSYFKDIITFAGNDRDGTNHLYLIHQTSKHC